jgi:hypothetical protein
MGNGIITALPEKIDKQQCQSMLGSVFDEKIWSEISMKRGYITKEQFQAIISRCDVFLTHDWGTDGKNHSYVAKINSLLKKKGLITWFDDEKMQVYRVYSYYFDNLIIDILFFARVILKIRWFLA